MKASKPLPHTERPREKTFIDGQDHINIWAQGDTELGRLLAHFTFSPFVHPYFGPFNSMEGFWHYIKTEEKDDALRRLHGLEAKKYGKRLTEIRVDNFPEIIKVGNYHKIDQNPRLRELFVASTLPFESYYRHGPGGVVIRPESGEWLAEQFDQLRTMMQYCIKPTDPDYSHVTKRSL